MKKNVNSFKSLMCVLRLTSATIEGINIFSSSKKTNESLHFLVSFLFFFFNELFFSININIKWQEACR